jgi:hypothetical protein
MLQATRDVRKVVLWLGHNRLQRTQIYLRADPTKGFEALVAGTALALRPSKFSLLDKLISRLKHPRSSYIMLSSA